MTLRSLVDCDGYDEDEADFCRRLDTELFPQLDGTPMNGRVLNRCWHWRGNWLETCSVGRSEATRMFDG